ncbi:histidine--tRNA ligase [Anaeromicropila populeti]|uniref:Histidyl-tRNA synthetase n=1 Tax=Anaeromicropila populeti TaxID=37658 RepID=A0A1I6IWF7_9FIRM|nr:HisS family protein [Anaeromicropila populeti]SFR71009.1 histidyl-tRNA synthetase [Anaeromicropila populeti]
MNINYNDNKINLSIPDGTYDILGDEMRFREYVISQIRSVYERFGFMPQSTPIIEKACVFKGHHGEGEKLIFNLIDKNNTKLVLRYDLTVPLARIINMHPDIPMPYKRYQLSTSYRDDTVDKSHLREFTQCDADIVGTSNCASDAEIILMAYNVLKAINIEEFTLMLNHRLILRGMAYEVGITTEEQFTSFQCVLDNNLQDREKMSKNLCDNLRFIGIDKQSIDKVVYIIYSFSNNFFSQSIFQILDKIKTNFGHQSLIVKGVNEVEKIISLLPDEVLGKIHFNLGLARGANYYTGVIFEAVVNNMEMGSVLGGGRYDNLIKNVGNRHYPAVGFAIGLDRVLTVLNDLHAVELNKVFPSKLLVACENQNDFQKTFHLINRIRNYIDVDYYYNEYNTDILNYIKRNHYKCMLVICKNSTFKLINYSNDKSFVDKVVDILESITPFVSIESEDRL